MAMNFPTPTFIGQQYSNGFATYSWDGTGWNIVPQMGPVFISDTPPPNPAVGQEWWRSTNGQLYVWYDDGTSKQWVQSAGAAGSPGLWEPIPVGNQRGLIRGTGVSLILVQNLEPYLDIRMYLKAYVSNGTDQPFYMQFSKDNGATWLSTATQYREQLSENSGTSWGGALTSSSVLAISGTVACNHIQHEIILNDFNWAFPTFFDCNGSVFRATGDMLKNSNVGYEGSGLACNALKIYGPPAFDYRLVIEGVRG